MSFRVAIATSDKVVVNQHFGHTENFSIYDVQDEMKYIYIEDRFVQAPCSFGEHDQNLLEEAVNKISDCNYVLCYQIGKGAYGILQERGILAYQIGDYIEPALYKLWNIVKQS